MRITRYVTASKLSNACADHCLWSMNCLPTVRACLYAGAPYVLRPARPRSYLDFEKKKAVAAAAARRHYRGLIYLGRALRAWRPWFEVHSFIKKNNVAEFTHLYMQLHCVRRSSWIATTLATLILSSEYSNFKKVFPLISEFSSLCNVERSCFD